MHPLNFLSQASLVMLLGLTACEANRTTAQYQTNVTQINGGTAVARPSFLTRTVASGLKTNIFFDIVANPDCSSPGVGTIRITQQPVHGTAEIFTSDEFPNFQPQNPRSACNTKRMPGIGLKYTSEADFTGKDIMDIIFIGPLGRSIDLPIIITIK